MKSQSRRRNARPPGLVVTVGVDDNVPAGRDHNYNELVVLLRNIDADRDPLVPITRFPDFTYKRRPPGDGNDHLPGNPMDGKRPGSPC